jgi:hypothetical protein
MKPAAQHKRRRPSSRPRKLIEAEGLEILDRARAGRTEYGIVDGVWRRATIADITQDKFSAVLHSFISRFWDLAGESIDAGFLPHQRQVTRKVEGEALVVQKVVSAMGTRQVLSLTQGFWTSTAMTGHSYSSWTVSSI